MEVFQYIIRYKENINIYLPSFFKVRCVKIGLLLFETNT